MGWRRRRWWRWRRAAPMAAPSAGRRSLLPPSRASWRPTASAPRSLAPRPTNRRHARSQRRSAETASTSADRSTVDAVGKTDVPTLAGVLAHARALVANDSGVMHLGAALGLPTVALFGPTDERLHRAALHVGARGPQPSGVVPSVHASRLSARSRLHAGHFGCAAVAAAARRLT